MKEINDLSELIAAGWGDVRRDRIPANWRDLPAPAQKRKPQARQHHAKTLEAMQADRRNARNRRAVAAQTDALHATPHEVYLNADREYAARKNLNPRGNDWFRSLTPQEAEAFTKRRGAAIRASYEREA